jgi:hypothetical protein
MKTFERYVEAAEAKAELSSHADAGLIYAELAKAMALRMSAATAAIMEQRDSERLRIQDARAARQASGRGRTAPPWEAGHI